MEGTLIKTDRNGTRYFSSNVCRKCGGTGYLNGYEHIDGARCWRCGGDIRSNKELLIERAENVFKNIQFLPSNARDEMQTFLLDVIEELKK